MLGLTRQSASQVSHYCPFTARLVRGGLRANRVCLRGAAVDGEIANARAVAPFHLTTEITEAAENAEKRICPVFAAG
jgi:hypothetical protein